MTDMGGYGRVLSNGDHFEIIVVVITIMVAVVTRVI
jgi:hypothetical protein